MVDVVLRVLFLLFALLGLDVWAKSANNVEISYVQRNAFVYASPNANSKPEFSLALGSKVLVVQRGRPKGWAMIFDGKRRGWLQEEYLDGPSKSSARSYEYKEGGVNLRINPLGLVVRLISADLEFKLSSHFALGTSLGYMNFSKAPSNLTAYAAALRSTFSYPNKVNEDSFYFALAGGWTRIKLEVDVSQNLGEGAVGTATTASWFVGSLVGYHWFFRSGFNVYLGGGFSYYNLPSSLRLDVGTLSELPGFRGFMPAGEFSLGYVF